MRVFVRAKICPDSCKRGLKLKKPTTLQHNSILGNCSSRKRKLKTSTFKTGERPILWQEQFEDFQEEQFLKTVLYFISQIGCKSFACFFF